MLLSLDNIGVASHGHEGGPRPLGSGARYRIPIWGSRAGGHCAQDRRVAPRGTIFRSRILGRGCRTRSEEHTSELQSLMRISYAVFCLKKKKKKPTTNEDTNKHT